MEPRNRHLETHLERDARLRQAMRRQLGLFTRKDALAAGFTGRMIRSRIERGRWEIADFQVFRLAGTRQTWEQGLLASCLAGPAVASHRAAARLWRLPGFDEAPAEVTALRHRRRRRDQVRWHESFHLGPDDITTLGEIPVTGVVRTLIDLAVVCPADVVERALDAAVYRDLADDAVVQARVERFGKRPGLKRMRALLETRHRSQRPAESVLETAFRQLVRSAGLPEPEAQVSVVDRTFHARIDFAYPHRRIAIEVDGAATHTSRLDRQRDLERQNRLNLLGWHVLRFTWDDVTSRADDVAEQLRRALASR